MIGPGTLTLVVGPSGGGKDTLIALVRARCADRRSIVFPRRTVTRAATEYEDHDSVSEMDFAQAEAAGAFALSWRAHGLCYGVPVAIDDAIRDGKTVICNVSRAVITPARAGYGRCAVVLVTAPPEILKERLLERSRASDGSVTGRMDRPGPSAADMQPDLVIENTGDPQAGAAALLRFIDARTFRL